MLKDQAQDVKAHKWFDGIDWDLIETRRMEAPRKPKNDQDKRLKELAEGERRQDVARPQRESPEELQECEVVFADF